MMGLPRKEPYRSVNAPMLLAVVEAAAEILFTSSSDLLTCLTVVTLRQRGDGVFTGLPDRLRYLIKHLAQPDQRIDHETGQYCERDGRDQASDLSDSHCFLLAVTLTRLRVALLPYFLAYHCMRRRKPCAWAYAAIGERLSC
mgnify:CR=1 FL=1